MTIAFGALLYLKALYGQCKTGQIVFCGPEQNVVAAVFDVSELEAAAEFIENCPHQLFFKVNPIDRAKTLARSQYGTGQADEVVSIVSIHLDVDANKSDKYGSQDQVLAALAQMPLKPSIILLSDGDNGGFHVYWLLNVPFELTNEAARILASRISKRWETELRRLAGDKEVDKTGDIARLLRPLDSLRNSGNRVKVYTWFPELRYSIEDFELPPLETNSEPSPEPSCSSPSGGVISDYLDHLGLRTPHDVLMHYGYKQWKSKQGFYIRPKSESGMYSCKYFENGGTPGFTFYSGAAHPFDSGGWYTREALYVGFEENRVDKAAFKKVAEECHKYFKSIAPKVDFSAMDNQPLGPAGQQRNAESQSQANPKPQPDADSGPQPKASKPPQSEPPTKPANIYLTSYLHKLNTRSLPQLYQQHSALKGFEIGPGLMTAIAAPPGTGKTALAMQAMFDAIELDPTLRVVIANAEMDPETLLRRQLTREARIKSDDLRFGNLTPYEMEQVNTIAANLERKLANVSFLDPCNLTQLTMLKGQTPGMLIVDYLQIFAPSDKDTRQGVNEVVKILIALKLLGWGVLALSAVKRNPKGKYVPEDLDLSSFKESGEIEFQADSAYVLVDHGPVDKSVPYVKWLTLKHVKNRHSAMVNFELIFHMPRMEFSKKPEAADIEEMDANDPFRDED
jgi:hypothetical protein